MHPALSVIFFTVVSGTGYGLLFLLGSMLAVDARIVSPREAVSLLVVGALFAAAGLTSSMLHLGQPQRAWRALSQWRSSWLSREGVCALCSFAPVAALAWLLVRGGDADAVRGAAALLAALAALTVFCTARIYTSLKTIPAWRDRHVLPAYLLQALLGGAAWWWALAATAGDAAPYARQILPVGMLAAAAACVLVKLVYWRRIDTAEAASTPETATGLGRFGTVRSVEAPHTEENYLTREMGFALARKHAQRLRRISLVLLGPVAALFVGVTWFAQMQPIDALCAMLAASSITLGLFVERWLFFAEAKHVVMLYYGDAHPNRA